MGGGENRSDCVSSVPQDVLYPMETVVQAAGYVIHQVTAVDCLKTGDQVQLHLDQVHPAAHTSNTPEWNGRPLVAHSKALEAEQTCMFRRECGGVLIGRCVAWGRVSVCCLSGPQAVVYGESHGDAHPQLRPEGGPGSVRPAEGVARVGGAPPL